jgi:peptidoglycan/LPS O-acetylase OafA/YrhL
LTAGHRFVVLDSWRGLCALLVALFHWQFFAPIPAKAFFANSFLFVDFFFVLSGFVISHAYGTRLSSLRDLAGFILRRFGRLWPLHAAMLFFFVALRVVADTMRSGSSSAALAGVFSEHWRSLASNLVLVHGFGLHDKLTWNTPSWSISTEFWTYLLFGALALLLSKRMQERAWLLVGVVGVCVVSFHSARYMDTTYDYGFFRCLAGFFAGCIAYSMFQVIPPGWAAGSRWSVSSSGLEVLAVGATGAFVLTQGGGPWSLAAPLVFFVVVLVFSREQGLVSRVLKTRLPRHLGDWSYSIYMVHVFLLVLLTLVLDVIERRTSLAFFVEDVREGAPARRLLDLGGGLGVELAAFAFLAAVAATAALTYRYIELPARAWFNSRSNRILLGNQR